MSAPLRFAAAAKPTYTAGENKKLGRDLGYQHLTRTSSAKAANTLLQHDRRSPDPAVRKEFITLARKAALSVR